MLRPGLFLDSNICIDVANGNIPAPEWTRVCKHIRACYRYCISFVTIKELLGRLARCEDKFFEINKSPLRILYGSGHRKFLAYPPSFAIRNVLRYDVSRKSDTPDLSEEEWTEAIFKAVLRAPTKAKLKNGIPVPNHRRLIQTFDLDEFDRHEGESQTEHAHLLEGMRNGLIDKPDPRKWAAWLLHQFELTPRTEDCDNLVASLDAAYRYGVALSRFTSNSNYNFYKPTNITAWGDIMQLFYLCHERMHFLTRDNDFRTYTRGSPQSNRVLDYKEFVSSFA